ncbi:MAG: hypothetical protein COW05_01810 [Gammaproteobacteria bacterium CG12_big_fil_rev_8_21_14_0_65_46_12]|nr:MAG: hypothetical protein COW05_01810 [Gammaproteobacteria bacterium CG12_big_fil_rev_8_21_14_0_65_46_12]
MDLRRTIAHLQKVLGVNDADISKATGISTPTISRIKTGGSDDPRLSTLKPLAEFFQVTIGQLTGLEALPAQYSNKNVIDQHKVSISVPLINWEQAAKFEEIVKTLTPRIWPEWLAANAALSNMAYALKINQRNLVTPFSEGSIIVVDPLRDPIDQDYILIKAKNSDTCILRRRLEEANQAWIQPLQPGFETRLLNDEDKFCGVVQQVQLLMDSQKRGIKNE